jgi:3-dehydroquinate synthase
VKRPAIVFIGFMGAGKSTAVQALDSIVARTEDVDVWIERRVGMTVLDFFKEKKESGFREVEEEVVCELLADADGAAVALGGGSILSERVRAALKDHIVVWLDVDKESAWGRVQGSERPLAQERAWFDKLFDERRPLYEKLADAVLPVGNSELVVRALDSIRALQQLPAGTKLLWASSASGEYPIYVGWDLFGHDWWPLAGRRFCVSDSSVAPLYADRIEPLAARVEVAPGEASKDLDEVARIVDRFTEAGMTRSDHVVALGGGVVGDLAGFCAHIYQRGVPVVQIPTTLVAQVDSAYGGKTGVDTDLAKNYIGAYHQPSAVMTDIATLKSLPSTELASGFVEVLKTGLLAGGRLWEKVRNLRSLDIEDLDEVVFDCARYKCSIVAADERDSGLRQVLNLGHTVGHSIEAATEYTMRHGEAVGLGLLAALRLSAADALRNEVEEILVRHDLPVVLRLDSWDIASEGLPTNFLMEMVTRDKKRTSEGVGFVLLNRPGEPRTGQIVARSEVEAAIEELYAR